MSLDILITTAGRAAIVNAQNNGTNAVTIFEIGLSGTAIVPTVADTVLPGEFKRIGAISGQVVADDIIHISFSDESGDAYSLRSFALYLDDGTLFAIYGQALPILEKTAVSIGALSIDIQFADIAAAAVMFGNSEFVNPPATTEVKGVVELATVAEAQAGIDALRTLTPASARAAILGWLLAQDGAGSGLDADLLDGQQGSYYTNIVARLGYTPLDIAGGNMAGLLTVNNTANNGISSTPAGGQGIQVRGNGTGPAILSFNRHLNYAVHFGLDIDNRLKFGGWSVGAAHELWHGGNDGSGSGLDADMLDGQQGSYYTDIAARLGYTPLNAINYTASDIRTKLLTVDGSGSGIDADLLDGQHGSFYTDIIARLGYSPANRAGDNFTGGISIPVSTSLNIGNVPNTRHGVEVIGNGTGPAIMTFHRPNAHAAFLGLDTDNRLKFGGWSEGGVHEIWHSGNDGPGSGLDADLLDGFEGGFYLRTVAASLASNGYIRLANGLIIQWGRWISSAISGSGVQVNFPIAFSAEPFALNLTPVVTSNQISAAWADNGITATGFQGRCSVANIGCRYIAIGT